MSDGSLKLFTIGFTKKTAEHFFGALRDAGVKRVVDVRLNNVSQLAGFSKKSDLKYFLKKIVNIEYVYLPELAPTKDILDAYKKHKGAWDDYERAFVELMRRRRIETLSKDLLNDSCLLCSEDKPHHCHRRLVVDFLNDRWNGSLKIKHLV